ncbi:MAG: metal ABC transporter permease [Phycisphaerales bacterium]|nr:metal ABC transporter permease [Planctomycetota bacterium]MCH8507560.1 metal ABC transporter permease [Phycisphaerales bacterium]
MQPPTPPTDPTFLSDLWTVLTLRAGFNTTTVIVGVTLLGLASGVVGSFALLRKRSLTSDAIAHAMLPGVATAYLAAVALGVNGKSLPVLLLGAAVAGLLGALMMHAINRLTRLEEDAAIGITLSVTFGLGVVLLSYIQRSPQGSAAGLHHFIFGQTAAMLPADAKLMGALALTALILGVLLFKELRLLAFNANFAQTIGLPVQFLDLALLALIVLVTVAGIQAVGIILVIALLIIPPAAARFWTDRSSRMVALGAVIGAGSGYLGAAISALAPNTPAGAAIVLTAGAIFFASMLLAPRRGALATTARAAWHRFRIATDHALENLYLAHTHDHTHPPRRQVIARPVAFYLQAARLAQRSSPVSDGGGGQSAARPEGEVRVTSHTRLTPTKAGLALGAQLRRNHLLWEEYLVTYADIARTHTDWPTDQVEHILDDTIIHRLESALEKRGVRLPPPA